MGNKVDFDELVNVWISILIICALELDIKWTITLPGSENLLVITCDVHLAKICTKEGINKSKYFSNDNLILPGAQNSTWLLCPGFTVLDMKQMQFS